jgi:lysophospholipase L1-like esterase
VAGHIDRYGAAWDDRTRAALETQAPLWVVLGDSTAQGIGAADLRQSYVLQLYEQRPRPLHDLAIVNVSVSGARVADLLTAQLPVLRAVRERVALVTCSIGSNDLLRSPDPRGVTRALRQLFAALAGHPTVAVATLPIGSLSVSGRVVNAMIRREAPQSGLLVADVHAHYRPPSRGKVAPDRFHPNGDGYADWAAAFALALDW